MVNQAGWMTLIESASDRESFEKLVKKYQKRMLSLAYKMLSNKSLAEEAVSESLFRIAKCYARVRTLPSNELEAYIIVTVRNACYKIYSAESKVAVDMSLDVNTQLPSFKELEKYNYVYLKTAIETLEQKYKDVLVFTYFYDMTAEETAILMGISRRTVYNYLLEAKDILSKGLGAE